MVLGLDFLKSISFLVGYDLETSLLAWSLHDIMHGTPLRSILRIYLTERLTFSKSILEHSPPKIFKFSVLEMPFPVFFCWTFSVNAVVSC